MFIIDLQPNPSKEHIKFFEDGEVDVQFEQLPIGPLIHCTLSNWNKDVLYKCYLIFEEICKEMVDKEIETIFALVRGDDNKHKKFVSLFGFEYFAEGKSTDNEDFQLWSLDTKEYVEDCKECQQD